MTSFLSENVLTVLLPENAGVGGSAHENTQTKGCYLKGRNE